MFSALGHGLLSRDLSARSSPTGDSGGYRAAGFHEAFPGLRRRRAERLRDPNAPFRRVGWLCIALVAAGINLMLGAHRQPSPLPPVLPPMPPPLYFPRRVGLRTEAPREALRPGLQTLAGTSGGDEKRARGRLLNWKRMSNLVRLRYNLMWAKTRSAQRQDRAVRDRLRVSIRWRISSRTFTSQKFRRHEVAVGMPEGIFQQARGRRRIPDNAAQTGVRGADVGGLYSPKHVPLVDMDLMNSLRRPFWWVLAEGCCLRPGGSPVIDGRPESEQVFLEGRSCGCLFLVLRLSSD